VLINAAIVVIIIAIIVGAWITIITVDRSVNAIAKAAAGIYGAAIIIIARKVAVTSVVVVAIIISARVAIIAIHRDVIASGN
jgi:hypothetical protein